MIDPYTVVDPIPYKIILGVAIAIGVLYLAIKLLSGLAKAKKENR